MGGVRHQNNPGGYVSKIHYARADQTWVLCGRVKAYASNATRDPTKANCKHCLNKIAGIAQGPGRRIRELQDENTILRSLVRALALHDYPGLVLTADEAHLMREILGDA